MIHAVLGSRGEVGHALVDVLTSDDNIVHEIDLDTSPGHRHMATVELLHVAIGYHPGFEAVIHRWAETAPHANVLVHSTVPIGVTGENGWYFSPVTGRHPHLATSLRVFTKPVAGPDIDIREDIVTILRNAGIPADDYGPDTASLEASKLFDLIIYGANIRITKEIERVCRERGLDFDTAYRDATDRYNTGYALLPSTSSDRIVSRPDLDHVSGPIGGHCVGYPNLALLDDERLEALVAPATKEHWDPVLD